MSPISSSAVNCSTLLEQFAAGGRTSPPSRTSTSTSSCSAAKARRTSRPAPIRNRLFLNPENPGNLALIRQADVNGNGDVSVLDLICTRNRLGRNCP